MLEKITILQHGLWQSEMELWQVIAPEFTFYVRNFIKKKKKSLADVRLHSRPSILETDQGGKQTHINMCSKTLPA